MIEKLNFSWVIPKALAASSVPSSKKDLHFLIKEQGIDTVITLTENNLNKYIKNFKDLKTQYNFKHYHVPTVDGTGFFPHQFEKISKIVEDNIANNKKVLVHCEGGFGRTSTVLTAIWMAHFHKNVLESIEELKKPDKRPQLIFTEIQLDSLKVWENELDKQKKKK